MVSLVGWNAVRSLMSEMAIPLTVESIWDSPQKPMAPGLDPTFLTSSALSSRREMFLVARLELNGCITFDLKVSHVPDWVSLEKSEMGRSEPPSCFQFLVSPEKMDAICFTVSALIGFDLLMMTATPSRAMGCSQDGVFSFPRPFFWSSFSSFSLMGRDVIPISQ